MIWRNTKAFWLRPGMRVKRYLALAVLGFLLAVLGAALVLPEPARGLLPAGTGLLLLAVGVLLLVEGVRRMNRSVLANFADPDQVPRVVYNRRSLARGPRVVAFGGGTGLSRLLRGLKERTANTTAVVAATDDGGSTGRLRRDFEIPAVGDLVDCMAALSEARLAPELMQFRFRRGKGLEGHTFGNLFLVTLYELTRDFAEAMRSANRLLALLGWVWPSTYEPAELVAELEDGRTVRGESRIREAGGRVRRVELSRPEAAVMAEVEDAISRAELLVLGPGSLYTSIVASFLPAGVRERVKRSRAPLVQVVNLMTEPGETDGMDAFDHVRAVAEHLGRWPDVALVHTGEIPKEVLDRYAAEGRFPVVYDPAPFAERGIRVITDDFREEGELAQHDPKKLIRALVRLRM